MLFLQNKLRSFALIILITGFAFNSNAQLTTSTAMSPALLVQNVLLGTGITASGITYSGAASARGTFNGTLSNIGLSGGVLLATGNIANAVGPNNNSGITTAFAGAGDPDLDLIMAPTNSNDAVVLQFDFIPTSDTVKFRYVFGSDEYMEFVSPGSTINDGFGFFISGPGIAGPFSGGAKNIAIIPGTALPVTMQNLNLISNSSYYFDNGDGMGSGTAPDGATVQYDGFTIPMTAVTAVECGQVYHIKIAIGDGGDDILDSGVFLEEGSFASTGSVFITPTTSLGGATAANDTAFYEGCGSAKILFDRGINNLSNADTVVINYSGTATNGVDYSLVSDSLFYAVGQDSAFITINSIADALVEGTETVVMSIYATSPCGTHDTISLTLYIIDSPPISLSLSNDTLLNCPSTNIPLSATASGGVAIGNYTYTWTGSSSVTDTAHVNPMVTTTYYGTVTDTCGNTASDSVKVTIVNYVPLQLSLNNDTSICGGNDVFLDADVTNGRMDYVYSWSPGISALDTATVYPLNSTSYILTVTDACGKIIKDTVNITVFPVHADFGYNFITNQNVQFFDQSSGALTYLWNFGDSASDSSSTESTPVHDYLNDGTYIVTLIITNAQGCTDTISKDIVVLPDFYFYYPNAFTPNSNGTNDVFKGSGVGIKSYHMRIFDRWGDMLFESSDINIGWDGTYKGKNVPSAVYVVQFNLEGYHFEVKQIINNVNLIR